MTTGETDSSARNLCLAVMGAGQWGSKLVRVFNAIDKVELKWVVDPDPEALKRAHLIAPNAKLADHISSALDDVQAVAVCTPARDHFRHVKALLENRKDVFAEKPIAMHTQDAKTLAKQAAHVSTLMVGHQLLFHSAFCRLKSLISKGTLGRLHTIQTERTGMIDFSREPDVLWAYGPHDVAMTINLTNEEPHQVIARGRMTAFDAETTEVADIELDFPSGVRAGIHLSSKDQRRSRRFIAVGEKKAAVFDDTQPGGHLFLLDEPPDRDDLLANDLLSNAREIQIQNEEPLALECAHFVDCVLNRKTPLTNPEHATAVTRVLEMATIAMGNS